LWWWLPGRARLAWPQDLFDALDSDGSGVVTREKLAAGLIRAVPFKLSKEDVFHMAEAMDWSTTRAGSLRVPPRGRPAGC